MRRHTGPESPGTSRLVWLTVSLIVLTSIGIAPVSAQALPPCDEVAVLSDCVLPDWPESSLADTPSLFGEIAARSWVTDEIGDSPPPGLDIVAVGVGRVDIDRPASIRQSPDLLISGKPNRAVPSGEGIIVRVVLDRAVDDIEDGHASVHVATDIDGTRSNNAPAGVGKADRPFAGTQDIYSVAYATTTAETRLLDSNLAKGWYRDNDPFASAWAAPNVLDILMPVGRFGEGFKVITYVNGPGGGYDAVTLGPTAIPVDGRLGLLPVCAEGSVSNEPFTVRRLIENGQTLRDIEVPASWHGGATFALDEASREALGAVIADSDEAADGRLGLASTVSLVEDGLIIRQRPEIELALDGDSMQLAVQLGLTRRGYNVIRDIQIRPTGVAAADAYLERAARALVAVTPSFRINKKSGLLHGEAIGACVPALISAPAPVPDEVADGASPAPNDAAAASA